MHLIVLIQYNPSFILLGNKKGPFIKSRLSQVGPKKLNEVNFFERALLLEIIFEGKIKFGTPASNKEP